MKSPHKTLAALSLLGALNAAYAKEYLCVVPGSRGGGVAIQRDLQPALAKRGVPFIPFNLGDKGTVEERAEKLGQIVSEHLAQDPEFRCHMVGHCYGGIVARYAYNHVQVEHPTRGTIPMSEIFLSYTSLQTAHQGTPLGDQHAKIVNGRPNVPMEMSTGYSPHFNSPSYPESYSPLPETIPVFSYRTTMKMAIQAPGIDSIVGFDMLKRELKKRGENPRNDGLIPLESQTAGHVIADLKLPHGYFSAQRAYVLLIPMTNPEFFAQHWKYLNSEDPRRDDVIREFFKSKNVLSEIQFEN